MSKDLATLVLVFLWTTTSIAALSYDGRALLQFKRSMGFSTGGEDPLSSWNESDPTPCSWLGIRCGGDARVVSLSLAGMNLACPVDTQPLGRLQALHTLSLELNNLTGTLSPSLATLPSLVFMNISNNNLSGPFPSNLTAMSALVSLDAYNNNFTGPLPPLLPPKLQRLHLGGSFFTGSIPASYGDAAPGLRYLAVSGNALTGQIPSSLGRLSRLQFLYLGYYNNYSCPIPPELGKLRNLIQLDLSYCNVVGEIPPELGDLPHLDTLFLQINSLVGKIPPELSKLSSLKSLDLSNNLLEGRIPDEFSSLESLELLSLFRNNLSGEIPSFIEDLPNLQVLYLWQNNFNGSLPSQLGAAAPLQAVDVSSNNLTGNLPTQLCDNHQLRVLIARDNKLTGTIPDSLGNCTSLERVRLGDNFLSGGLPAGLLALPNLTMVELMRNKLDGTIKDQDNFKAAINLTTIDLSENLLHGGVPRGLGHVLGLKKLFLSWNRLSGPIPSDLAALSQLLHLNLSHNQLTGEIPAAIATNCERLTILDLSNNLLTGALPSQLFDSLPVLNVVNLSRNALTGGIPSSLTNAKGLSSLDLSFNRLAGPIPWCEQGFNSTSFAGNLALCGPPLATVCRNDSTGNSLQPSRRPHNVLLAWLVGAIFTAAFAVLIAGICCFLKRYAKGGGWKKRQSWWSSTGASSWKLTAFQRLDFTASQVIEAMVEENIIGRGASGVVYKAAMPSGEVVAVKRLLAPPTAVKSATAAVHRDRGFAAEITTLGKIRHRNIVKLLGYVVSKRNLTNVLIYEYMPNGSLGEAIHGNGEKSTGNKKGGDLHLDWETRYKISVQAANGLCYLHHDCSPLIVHRDVKSNNILLDAGLEAHVADFGLAKLFHDAAKSESMSSIAGSYGYIAPEYAYTLKVNEKSDIYSFGVVLLELVTGRKPIEPEFGDGVDLVQWVRKKIQTKDGVFELLDSRMNDGSLPLQEVMVVLRVALLCTSDLPADRPTMRDVVQLLGDARPISSTTDKASNNKGIGNNKKQSNSCSSSSNSGGSDEFGDLSSQLIPPV